MLTRLTHLALETKNLDAARAFYADRFGLSVARETAEEVVFPVGETTLRRRRPTGIPRGALHSQYRWVTTMGRRSTRTQVQRSVR